METEISGTLLPDGTLSLDHKPDLPAGRVTVVVRPLVAKTESPPTTGDWWQALQDARRAMEEAGCKFLNEEELEAAIREMREDDPIDEMMKREAPRSL